jgi:hypothetical protein
MVTRASIIRLSSQIEELSARLGVTPKPTYKVYFDFGETDKEWNRNNPDAGPRHEGVILRFGHGAEKFVRVPQPE